MGEMGPKDRGLGARWGSLVHHRPVASASRELTGAAPGGRFRWENLTLSGGKGRGDIGEPYHGLQCPMRWRRWPGDDG
jgi:hypothetical protein